jgi:hypothetical protein
MLDERGVDVAPRRLVREDEVVQAAEQPERVVPVEVGIEIADPRILREPATQIRVERRPAVAVDGLAAEDLRLPCYLASAALACSAISPNFAGSVVARSASTLRSRSISAAFRPAMNWL